MKTKIAIITSFLALGLTGSAKADLAKVTVGECQRSLTGEATPPAKTSDNDVARTQRTHGAESYAWAQTSLGTLRTTRYGKYRLIVWVWYFKVAAFTPDAQPSWLDPGYCVRNTAGTINDSVGPPPKGWQ